ncbi:MAG: hypothetical protein KAS62_08010 [Candidatus Delongbacteria bacterium]|nr:hypothetical protein [Candidatus Delongbacteria bacterium]
MFKKQIIIFFLISVSVSLLVANTIKKYELYDREATHYLLNALMFEEYSDMERAIVNYESAYRSSNATFLLISKAIDEYYLGNDEAALKIFESITELSDQLLKYKYYQYLLSNTERKEYVSSELLNELIELYSEDSPENEMKEGLFLLEKLLKNYMKYNKASDFELFIKDAISRKISQTHKDFFSAVLFKFHSKVEKDNDKVTKYVDDLVREFKESDYKILVFVYDELIDSKNLENAEKVYEILKKVRYLDPEYYIFNYSLEKAKGNAKKVRRIISYAQESFPGAYFQMLSLQEYLDQKQLGNANIIFNKLLLGRPDDTQLYQRYIMSLIENDYIDKAFEIYDMTISKFPKQFTLKNNYAYLLAQHNRNIEKALALVKNALNEDPNNISFLDTMAWIYYIKGDHQKAEEYIEQAFAQPGALLDANSKELYEHYVKIKTKLNKLDDIEKIKLNELAVTLHECINSAMGLLK